MTQQKKFFLAVLSALFSLSPAARGAAGFQTAQSYPVGTNPQAIAVGDFNGDGTADLAICNFGDPTGGDDGNLSLLLGKGTGKLRPATNFTAAKNTGDFDSDGRLDLLVVRAGDPTLAINGARNNTFH